MPPVGWVEFCAEHQHECKVAAVAPRDVVLTNKAWTDLVRINKPAATFWLPGNLASATYCPYKL